MSRVRPYALALVSALAFGLAFPPWRQRWLAWVALAPLLHALRGTTVREAVAVATTWSVAAAWTIGTWMAPTVARYFAQPPAVGVAFFFGSALLTGAPYYVGFALAWRVLARRADAWLPLRAAAAWAAAELARGRLLTELTTLSGNPWGLLGYSQAGWLPVLQVAAATGVYGVSFLLAAAGAGIATWWAGGGRRALVVGVAPGVLATVAGAALVATAPRDPAGPVVGVVQPDVEPGTLWRAAWYGHTLDRCLRLTQELVDARHPALVVWPENALGFFLEDEPGFRAAIARVIAPARVELVTGGPHADGPDAGPPYRNATFLLAPDGSVRARYDKQHLVPFAEMFPLGLDPLRRDDGRVREFTPGTRTAPLPTLVGAAGVLTCNEAMFPEVAARRVADGATWLVSPSNDSWTRDAQFSAMLFDIVALRAVEQRRVLVRASTAGPSAIVDAWGRVLAASGLETSAVLAAPVAARHARSVYGVVGDAFGLGCAGLTAWWLVAAARARARRRGDRPASGWSRGSAPTRAGR